MERLRAVEDVKRALAAKLRKPLRDDIWADLVRRRWPEDVLQGDATLGELVREYKALEGIYAPAKRKKAPVRLEIPPDGRLVALAQVMALEASRRPEVRAFREEILGGRLLKPEEVPDWIKRQSQQDGEPSTWVTIALPSWFAAPGWDKALGEILRAVADSLEVGREGRWEISFSTKVLSCKVAGREVWPVPVNHFGVLGRLRSIGEQLAAAYGWEAGEATTFVLTGIPPEIPEAVGYTIEDSMGRAAIQMKVNPRMSAREVARLYARLRSLVFRGPDQPMSEKHLALAVFAAEHADEEATWASLQQEWNQAHPEWAYTDWRLFARDVRTAWKRVTGRGWKARTRASAPSP